ncbi:MAG TPA: hypothetical protein V6D22_21745 [Candidatus Obscuribacterales bacterium]
MSKTTNHFRRILALALTWTCLTLGTISGASAASFSYTPDLVNNSVALEGLIPISRFMNIPLPKGSVEFEDGTLAINMVPNWNFDRVALLQGPIIRTEVTTNGREALIAGVVLFTQGYWYDKYLPPGARETVTTTAGLTLTGRISNITPTTLAVETSDTSATVISLADIKELHSPRAFAFVVPALAASAITPESTWNADVQTVTLAATVAPTGGTVIANARRDPLLRTSDRDLGDWSNAKMVIIGTALSLANLAQFTPELILPQLSHQLWQHNNKKSFFTQTSPLPPVPAPLINGNTYSLPIPGNATH